METVAFPYDERPGLERYAAPAPESFGPYRKFCGTRTAGEWKPAGWFRDGR